MWYRLQQVDSTNRWLKRAAMDGAPDRTVAVADSQSAGHGRFGRRFVSPAGGLYMSVLYRRAFSAEERPLITVAAAVAAAEAVEAVIHRAVGIKWVNDLYLDGRKICGILAEGMTDPECVVLGLGLNLRPPDEGWPPDAGEAGALFSKAPPDELRWQLAESIEARLADYMAALPKRDYLTFYRERSILTGRTVTYYRGNTLHTGTVLGVDDNGGLLVSDPQGEPQRLSAGEVTLHKERI